MNIYEHELSSYLREISQIKSDISSATCAVCEGANFTHYSLGLSNRSNMVLVGLCGLVEALLTELALEQEQVNQFKLNDIRGAGYSQLRIYLSRSGVIDFGALRYWEQFIDIYRVRNVIVHGHGGLVPPRDMSALEDALTRLGIPDVLVGGRRVRMHIASLHYVHSVITKLIKQLLEILAI